jgi:hypothetical protein
MGMGSGFFTKIGVQVHRNFCTDQKADFKTGHGTGQEQILLETL